MSEKKFRVKWQGKAVFEIDGWDEESYLRSGELVLSEEEFNREVVSQILPVFTPEEIEKNPARSYERDKLINEVTERVIRGRSLLQLHEDIKKPWLLLQKRLDTPLEFVNTRHIKSVRMEDVSILDLQMTEIEETGDGVTAEVRDDTKADAE